MSDALLYYYNISVQEKINNNVVFFINSGEKYMFVPYERDINDLQIIVNCSQELIRLGYKCHEIIPNKFGEVLSGIKDKKYILLKILDNPRKQIDLCEIIESSLLFPVNFKKVLDTHLSWNIF